MNFYQEGSVHTTHTSESRSREGSHISQRQYDNKAMQKEIDDLKKKLHRATTNENTRACLAKVWEMTL